ncbi:MAG: oligosaccharide flippase family protein [Lacunisphaera sp.]
MTVALQVLRFGVNLGVSMALARLIVPEDFGIFAMAGTFTGLLFLFKDAGMESALVSHGALTDAELAALASLNCLHGLLLALGCAALGPALAHLYGEPKLATALLLPATGFLFYGLDVQPGTQLLRTQRFRTHAAIETAAMLAGLIVALWLAWRGAGHWALFTTEPVTAAALLAGHAWAVRWRPRFSLAWGAAPFGRDVSLTRALGYAGRNVDILILGLAAGPVSLASTTRPSVSSACRRKASTARSAAWLCRYSRSRAIGPRSSCARSGTSTSPAWRSACRPSPSCWCPPTKSWPWSMARSGHPSLRCCVCWA